MAVEDSGGEGEGTRPGRAMVTTALLLAMAVAALEQTVVSTAMPSIISQLKGLDIYPWVFSAYLLATTVTTPIYGKLADVLGPQARAPVRPGAVRAGVDALGPGAEHARADRDARRAGAGRRGGRADRPDAARRPVHAPGARQGPGPLQRRVGRVEPDRPGARGRADRPPLVALGVLRDGAVRAGRHVDPGAARPRARRAEGGPPDRLVGRGPADGRFDPPADGGPARGRALVGRDGRDAGGGGRPAGELRLAGDAGGRPDPAARPDLLGAPRGGDRRELPDRRPAVRHRHLRAPVRPGGPGRDGDPGRADGDASVPVVGRSAWRSPPRWSSGSGSAGRRSSARS